MQPSSTVALSWGASAGATYYDLGVTDVAAGALVVDTTTNSPNYTANLSPGKTYRWNVAAGNEAGLSNYTTVIYFQTPSDPTATTYSILPNPGSVSESGGTITFTVIRSGGLPAETVYVSTTQDQGYTNNGDYTGFLSQSLSFTSNQTQKTVTVSITNDSTEEPDEKFGLIVQRNASDLLGTYLAKTTFNILNDDSTATTYSISPNPGSVSESGGTITFTLTRSGGLPAETVYVSTTQDQGYTNNGDYTGFLSQSLSFTSNQTQRTVTVSITNDSTEEPDEKFGLIVQRNASDPLGTYLSKTTFIIIDDDTPVNDISAYFYSQRDSQWAGQQLGTGSDTIGNSGCALACVAMLLKWEAGSTIDPDPSQLNQWLITNGGYSNGDLINWDVAASHDGAAGLTWQGSTSGTNEWSSLDAELSAGRKPIVSVKFSSGIGHFVVVYEKSGASGIASSYKILDPWDYSFSASKTLESYRNVSTGNTILGIRKFGSNFPLGSDTPVLSVTPTNPPTQLATAGSISFSVSNTGGGTMNYTASVISGDAWLRVASGSPGVNSGPIVVEYDANNTGAQRSGTIQVTATGASGSPATITVTQAKTSVDPQISRSSVIGLAMSYAAYSWHCSSSNANSNYNHFVAGSDYVGVAYNWGGWDTITQFEGKINNGAVAGTTKMEEHADFAGVDCSGFVTRCWGITSQKYGTTTLGQISSETQWTDLRPGDILNLAGTHVRIFEKYDSVDPNKVWVYEATYDPSGTYGTTADPGRVVYRTVLKSTMVSEGYIPRRYNNIKEDETSTQFYSLASGLNLISFPFTPKAGGSQKFSEIFKSLGTDLFPYVFYIDDTGDIGVDSTANVSAVAKKAYFLFLDNPRTCSVLGEAVGDKSVTLRSGWNTVGVTSHVVPKNTGLVAQSAFYLDSSGIIQAIPLFQDGLEPGIGYWVYSFADGVTLVTASDGSLQQAVTQSSAGTLDTRMKTDLNAFRLAPIGTDFTCEVVATQAEAGASPVTLKFGMKSNATDGYDSGVDSLPNPPAPGSMTAKFNDGIELKNSYKAPSEFMTWSLLVRSEAPDLDPVNTNPVFVSWTIPSQGTVDPTAKFELLDSDGTVLVSDMRTETEISFPVSESNTERQYTIRATLGVPPEETRVISLSGNLDFGSVSVGSTAQRILTISNAGNSTLNVSSIIYPSGFSGAWSGSIAPGSSRNVTVTFSPTVPGSYDGAVTVSSDKTDGTNTISLSGQGNEVTNTRIISLSGNLDFGSVSVGSTAQRTLTISNTGNSTLNVSAIIYPNGFSGAWSGTIAAGTSHDVTVTFQPTEVGRSYDGSITVLSDATSGVNTTFSWGFCPSEPTTVFQPGPEGKDTYYGTWYATEGDGSAEAMLFGGWGDAYYSFIEFDLSALPSASQVSKVEIQLHLSGDLRPYDAQLQVNRITESWTEMGVNLSNHPNSVAYKPFGTIVKGWNVIDITDLYREWKTGQYPNYGVELSPGYTTESNASFWTSDCTTATLRPKLVITLVDQPDPSISSITPNPLNWVLDPHTITINGSNFVSGCTVELWDVTNGDGPYTKSTTFVNGNQVEISANFTNSTAIWSAKVINPDGTPSNVYPFSVHAIQYQLSALAVPANGGTVGLNPAGGTYDESTVVTVTATPAAGYRFVNWTGDATGSETSVQVTMDSNKTVMANFELIPVYTLTLSVDPVAGGTVVKAPDQANYEEGAVVTLTATPTDNYQFDGWYDGGTLLSVSTPYAYTIPAANKVLTAKFSDVTPGQYTVTVVADPAAGGTVSKSPDAASYVNGAQVTLAAASYSAYTFTGWYDGTTLISTDVTYVYTVAGANKTFTAKFAAKPTYTLTVTANPANGGSASKSPDQASYLENAQVTLTATATTGYQFDGWYDGVTLLSVSTPYVYTIPAANKTLAAKFSDVTPGQYTVTVVADPAAGGTVSKSPAAASYVNGAQVTLTAASYTAYTFTGWYDGATLISTDVTYVYTVAGANKTFTAKFAAKPTYTLTVTANPANGGSASKSPDQTSYVEGAQVTLTATATTGYKFDGWYDGVTLLSVSTPYVYTMSATNKTLTAKFAVYSGPETPTDVTAVGNTYMVLVSWNAVANATYVVTRTSGTLETTWAVDATQFADDTAVPGVSYQYSVKAFDTQQNESAPSLPVSAAVAAETITTANYKVTAKGYTMTRDAASNLTFTGVATGTIKIALLKKLPANTSDDEAKGIYYLLNVGQVPTLTIVGHVKTLAFDVPVYSLEITGAAKSVSAKSVTFLKAREFGSISIAATKAQDQALYARTFIATTGSSAVAMLIKATGAVIEEVDSPAQGIKLLNVASKVYKDASKATKTSLGAIGSLPKVVAELAGTAAPAAEATPSSILSSAFKAITVSGGSVVAEEIAGAIDKVTVAGGNLRPGLIQSSKDLVLVQATSKKGVGGAVGTPGASAALTIKAQPNTKKVAIGKVMGQTGVSGVFYAGYDAATGAATKSGGIGILQAKTGQVEGAAFLDPAQVAKMKLLPKGQMIAVNPE
jgi:hypothetical protein